MSLTTTGFARKRLAEIKAELDQGLNDALGPVNTNADSVVGQLSGLFSEAVDNAYEILQDTYDAMYPSSAEGAALDGAVAFVGLERLPATATTVTAAAYGTEGTFIPAGSFAHADIQYFSSSDVIISRANAIDVTVEVVTVTNSAAYNITAGGLSVTYNADSTATSDEIVAGLAALLNGDPLNAVVENGKLRVYAFDLITPFAITIDSKLNITKRASPVVFVASEKGARVVPVGGLSNIDTPIAGWDSLYNMAAGTVGRDVETDTELRARHALSVRSTGSATVEAIKARLLAEVPEVATVRIYENRTKITSVDGIPPNSYETVVQGGANADVANQLWLTKPAGIETHGNTTIAVTDSAGDEQIIKFSRPVVKYGWLTIAVSLYTEEVLPLTAEAAIKQAVVDYANANIGVGTDIILQRFLGPIYATVSGISNLVVTAAVTNAPTDTPSYGSANIAIAKAEYAKFDISRVTVTGV